MRKGDLNTMLKILRLMMNRLMTDERLSKLVSLSTHILLTGVNAVPKTA